MSYDETYPSDLDLSQYDDDFAKAPIDTRDFDDVPDGDYQVKVDKVEIVRSASSGNPMLKWALRILGDKYAGRFLWRNNSWVSDDPANKEKLMSRLRTDLHTCGVEIQGLSELPGRLGDLLDVCLEVRKRKNGDFYNIYINKRILLDGLGPDEDTLTPF